jgi:hypothetical protein
MGGSALKVMVAMPLQIYHGLLGRCPLLSREYAILRNSVIVHLPDDTLEILCDVSEAGMILDHARAFHPVAVPYLERSLAPSAAGSRASMPTQKAYRKKSAGETWHFCSNCSQWPTVDYVVARGLSEQEVLCNECLVRHQQANCPE